MTFRERYARQAEQIEALYADLANALDTEIPPRRSTDEVLEQRWGGLLHCLGDLAQTADRLHDQISREFPS